jgi:hypothetical protein
LGKGINTIGTLYCVRYGKGYEGLFPFGQLTLGKYGVVIIKKLLGQLRSFFADFFKFAKVFRFVISIHNGPPSRHLSMPREKTTVIVRIMFRYPSSGKALMASEGVFL